MRCALACVALAGLLGPMSAASQLPRSAVDTIDLFKMRADFTVPESPAFKLVDVDESAILRPASVRELAVAFSSFTDSTDGGLRLPKSVGIEVAPWLAAKSRTVKRPEYARRAWLYRFRVSGAVHTSEGARRPHELGGGLRFTFLDDADIRLDTILEKRILVILERIADVHTAAARRCLRERPAEECRGVVRLTVAEQEEVAAVEREITAASDDRAQELWNARSVHVALAFSGKAADTLGNGLRSNVLSAWASAALPTSRGTQLLVGTRGGWMRDTATGERKNRIDGSARFYVGGGHYRGFVEGQIGAEQDQEFTPWFLNSGAEVRLSNSVWAQGSAGYERGSHGEQPRLTTRFALRGAVPKL
jgi:hypothetical protein